MSEDKARLAQAERNGPCTLGMGCDEHGACYADYNGRPDMCGLAQAERGPAVTGRQWGEIPNVRTDDAHPINVLAGVLYCAERWVPEARIIGNVRAGDIVRAIRAFEPAALEAALHPQSAAGEEGK